MCSTAVKRAAYLKKHNILYHIGENCMTMFRKVPLYPKLISMGNNVWIASGVTFIPHDVIHRMLNNKYCTDEFKEYIGCIDIRDNVFIGSNAVILPNVSIGPNAIIAAGALVNRSLGEGVYAGVPARLICSIEEFADKRKKLTNIEIVRNKKGLDEKTVEHYWDHFRKTNGKGMDK